MRTVQHIARPDAKSEAKRPLKGLLEDELLDLYGAILIVIPPLLLVKSLWL
jgi:hypothetical protein